jgi:hypothetical protein
MDDLLIILPGILGSTLSLDGKEIWGLGSGLIAASLVSFGRNFERLVLPDGVGDEDPGDGVVPTGLMPSAQIIPGFWNLVNGYTELSHFLKSKFALVHATEKQAGNYIEFAYDWRLSNKLNGQRLAACAEHELERWRNHSKRPEAKLIFVCHSMGGLVARWFIEVLGGKELTRKLITIGTPYMGSINALENIANGFAPGFGRLRIRLDGILRSLPSVHQLLPTYKCVADDKGQMLSLMEADIPNLSRRNISQARSFHERIGETASRTAPYQLFALKGISQPTSQSVRVGATRVEIIRSYNGKDLAGDGTVPRPSAHPPEWEDEGASVFYGQQHGALQTNSDTLQQVFGILTGNLGQFQGGAQIGLDLPGQVALGDGLVVRAVSPDGDPTLPLQVELIHETGSSVGRELMNTGGDGSYSALFKTLPAGGIQIIVSSASTKRPIDPVLGLVLIWDDRFEEMLE